MKILKETTSISPLTNKVIPAKIAEENGRVYVLKEDEAGNAHKGLIEKDHAFYRDITSHRLSKAIPFRNIKVPISNRCNLECPVCCAADAVFPEPSLGEIESFVSQYKNTYMVLAGREPTMREDLEAIIEVVNRRNYSVLLTNGVKLADYEYVESLAKAGLNIVHFSFNGFSDEVYQATNGKPLLKIKLQALENIKKAGLPATLSATLVKGVNDNHVKQLFDYCVDNSSFINELRIRTVVDLGRNPGVEQFYLSELVDLVCDGTSVSKDAALKENRFLGAVARTFGLSYLLPKICTFSFHVSIEKDGVRAVGEAIADNHRTNSVLRYVTLPYAMLKFYGKASLKKALYKRKIIKAENSYPRLLRVQIKCWPNIYNVDLEETKKCSGGYCKIGMMGKSVSYCLGKIIEENSGE